MASNVIVPKKHKRDVELEKEIRSYFRVTKLYLELSDQEKTSSPNNIRKAKEATEACFQYYMANELEQRKR